MPVRVYYEDTDFTGIVYHGSYVRFFERGRSDFLRLLGIHHHQLNDSKNHQQLAFAVRSMNLEFLKPASIDDILEVKTALEGAKGARIFLKQRIVRQKEILCEADVVVAVISSDGRPTRMPRSLSEKLAGR
nr:tol-pal system-associated acyl-CoA thioesterase [Roseibium hamelinense]